MRPSSDCAAAVGRTFSSSASASSAGGAVVAACCMAFASMANFDNMSFKLPDALALWSCTIPELASTPAAGRAAEMTGV
jgi:hypothetical protein